MEVMSPRSSASTAFWGNECEHFVLPEASHLAKPALWALDEMAGKWGREARPAGGGRRNCTEHSLKEPQSQASWNPDPNHSPLSIPQLLPSFAFV